ncbi:uncharacterized protein F5147DRAFT_774357 [Suillus discolor]|uniref:Uncharacterized protein n=1 Tax=Suillus discolor TaxID=1912936 RepID=A0A9P7F6I8_9AGAM|nr:uncharacterized protein F5147DRAFT_774357 [Suillus discolor]KAG2107524.1 hypothetical protein F5147DRAFT_774357 [Suillus discolor]
MRFSCVLAVVADLTAFKNLQMQERSIPRPGSTAQTRKIILLANGQYAIRGRNSSPYFLDGLSWSRNSYVYDAAVMDAALHLIARHETCPQLQISEHLAAVEIMKLESIIILQNKIDLIRLLSTKNQSLHPVRVGPRHGGGRVVTHRSDTQPKYNIDTVNESIAKRLPIPVRDFASDPRLTIIRSFDIDKPGAELDELKSGVQSSQTSYELGQEVKNRLGIVTKGTRSQNRCRPIFSRIVSLHAENNHLRFAVPGG